IFALNRKRGISDHGRACSIRIRLPKVSRTASNGKLLRRHQQSFLRSEPPFASAKAPGGFGQSPHLFRGSPLYTRSGCRVDTRVCTDQVNLQKLFGYLIVALEESSVTDSVQLLLTRTSSMRSLRSNSRKKAKS